MDLQTKTYNKKLPYTHPLIQNLIVRQWFTNRKPEGVNFLDAFKNIPVPLLALTLTGVSSFLESSNLSSHIICQHQIDAAIREWSTGVRVQVQFTDSVAHPKYSLAI